jgi:membrane protein DedA with SNARE-associated domain
VQEAIEFLIRYGYAVLFVFVFFEQIGLPMPAIPFLLAAGALARSGRLELAAVISIAVVASLLADLIWYELGRRRGGPVLHRLCRIALEPDSCIRVTENVFARYGSASLLVAKFVPGLNTAAPPMAGMLRMNLLKFTVLDLLGALVWAGSFMGIGYLFSSQVERALALLTEFGGLALAVAAAGLGAYVSWKLVQRRRVMRELRVARISPDELKRLIDSGAEPTVVDLRHPLESGGSAAGIPGALRIPAEEVERRHMEIPRDRDIVLVCT